MSEKLNKDQDEYFQENIEHLPFSSEPPQTIVSLKKQQPNVTISDENQQDREDSEGHIKQLEIDSVDKFKNLQALRRDYQQKVQDTVNIKKNIIEKKQRIKDIGVQVDREMNKSLFKSNRSVQPVSIHDIFSLQVGSNNIRIKQLREELTKLRASIKKQKDQNKRCSSTISDPVHSSNFQRFMDLDIKDKEKMEKLKEIQRERDILNQQIQRIKYDMPVQYDQDIEQQTKRLKAEASQVLLQIKQQKHNIYDLDKADIILTEKMCFIREIIDQIEFRKHQRDSTMDPAQKQQIEEEIKNMSIEIKEVMDEKVKTENQRGHMVKFLTYEVKNLEKKNWETIQLLREIDNFLLRFYSAKLRDPRNSIKKREKERAEKSAMLSFNKKDEENQNDKNFFPVEIKLQPVFVEKRKHIEIGMVIADDYSITMNDQFLGLKNSLTKLCILSDDEYIYGIHGEYVNDKGNQFTGLNMLSRIKPKEVKDYSLQILRKQGYFLQMFHLGHDKEGIVKYLRFETSGGDQIEWGSLQKCVTNESKLVKKYEGITLKARLVQIGGDRGPNSYCLAGIGFSIVYFGTK